MLRLPRVAAVLVASAALVTAAPAAAGDTPPSAHSVELAKRLFSELNMAQMSQAMMSQVGPALVTQARKANPSLTDEQAKAISEAVAESTAALMTKVQDRMVPLYASTFTEKELQDLADFYDSPSGRAMVRKMPELAARLGPVMAELMPQMTADVQRRICAKTDCAQLKRPPKS